MLCHPCLYDLTHARLLLHFFFSRSSSLSHSHQQWTPAGDAFIIGSDLNRLESETLPQYFRHNRFQSLVRQVSFTDANKTFCSLGSGSIHLDGSFRFLTIDCHSFFLNLIAQLLFLPKDQSGTKCLDLQAQVVSP
jgi:hypothetical protein